MPSADLMRRALRRWGVLDLHPFRWRSNVEAGRSNTISGGRRHWSRKPPSVPFRIPGAILALPIGLIDGLRIDDRTSRARPLVVRIHIVHIHEETRTRDV